MKKLTKKVMEDLERVVRDFEYKESKKNYDTLGIDPVVSKIAAIMYSMVIPVKITQNDEKIKIKIG